MPTNLLPRGGLLRWRRGKRSSVEKLRRSTFASLLVGLFLAWVCLLGGFTEQKWPIPPHQLILGVLGVVAFSVLYVRMVRVAVAGGEARRELAVSGVIVVVLLLVEDGPLWSWGLLSVAWSSGAALMLDRFWTTVASVGAGALAVLVTPFGAASPFGRDPAFSLIAYLVMAASLPAANRFQLWFWKVVRAAEEGKEARARLAVTEERLRFSRDLHDLVGHSLSAIALKSEVAVKLSGVDVERAAAEMDEVRGLAREALKEIRTAVRGYRTVDLHAELRSMVAVLEAGGIRCALETQQEPVPEEPATLLAWVIREGTTNVLRHSSATRCHITIGVRDGTAVLEMTNDGVSGTGDSGGPGNHGGTGLTGLSERVTAVGGVLTAGAGGAGEFRLRATIPLEGAR
ncbi:sensor histidine kinase [Streptosporangium sp. NPDC051022]|uniref:sensor histidine kinase n=1 Tax=Streptosporangium sp. NPDC051022 TaxID=3155752 RepID=UPI003413E5B5